MQHFPDLRGAQELFWKLITAPEGVARGAAELHREGALESEDLSFLVPPGEKLGSAEQLDIYANMYFHRLHDCLAEDFPALMARLGGARFHNLVTDYLLAHPSTDFSLRELGRALPDFLASHALEREFPALADLARLEWARVDVFDEADAAPLSREEVLERGASEPEKLGLALIPAARLLCLDASALPLWKQLDAGERAAGRRRPARRALRRSRLAQGLRRLPPLDAIRRGALPRSAGVPRRLARRDRRAPGRGAALGRGGDTARRALRRPPRSLDPGRDPDSAKSERRQRVRPRPGNR